jgi:hypothetical protein
MADEILKRDQNFITVLGGITDDAAQEVRMLRVDPVTGRLILSITGIAVSATVDVGTTTTGAPGTDATVVNSGTTSAAIFDFTIPRGDVGAIGATGATPTIDDTSVTSNTIGIGSKVFSVLATNAWIVGDWLIIASDADVSNFMTGQITSYAGPSVTVNVVAIGGAGTFTDWNIGLSGAKGADGAGAGTVTSVSVTTANGISGSVANPTSTPAITLTLGAITPTSVAVTDFVTIGSYAQFAGIATPSTPAAGFVRFFGQDAGGITRLVQLTSSGLQLAYARDLVQRVFNPTGSTMTKGQAVYIIGQDNGFPSVNLSKSDVVATANIFGIIITEALAGGFGTVQMNGLAQNLDTSSFSAGDILYLSDSVAGALTATAPTSPSLTIEVGTVMVDNAVTGSITLDIHDQSVLSLDNLTDVTITTPLLDDFLRYNGTFWVNSPVGSSSAGPGIAFYNATPSLVAAGTNNITQILTLSKTPVVTAEQTITGTGDSASTPIPYSAWLYDTALGRTVIDGGVWTFQMWANINNAPGITTISRGVYAVLDEVGGVTGASTGAGTSRTFTASGGTPFAVAKINVGGTALTDSYLKTPQGIYRITARTSDTVVTIAVPTTYTNETTIAFSVWKLVVNSGESPDISTTTGSGNYQEINISLAVAAYTITTAHKLGAISFVTSTASRVVTVTYNGTARNTNFTTPLVTLHNNLAGLQGGTANEYYHLTSAEYTGSGTGVFARVSSPVFTTPNIGSATGSISGNAGTVTGFTAGAGVLTGPASAGVAVTLGNAEAITGVKTMSGLNVILHSSSGLTIRNPADTFKYTLTAAAIVADRTLNLPLLTGTDTLAVLDLAQTFTNKTLTAPVINAASISGIVTLLESTSIDLDPAQADQTWTGITRTGTAGATLAFGDLCYLAAADSRWELTDADSVTTSDRLLGMCVLAAAGDGSATRMLLMGNIQAASKFPAMTIGSAMYIDDTTPGALRVTIPTGADNVIRRVGYALTADELYFNPSMDSQTTVA